MIRIALTVCVFLIVGITAKPSKLRDKLDDTAFQETVMSMIDKDWGVEVEPPEDMDKTSYIIDHRMKIWSGHKGTQHQKAEEDLDEVHHPSVADLLNVQSQNLNILPAVEVHGEAAQDTSSTQPEDDKDDIYHPDFSDMDPEEPEQDWEEVYQKTREQLAVYLAPLSAGYKAAEPVPGPYTEPEEDADDVYHHEEKRLTLQMELQQHEATGEHKVRVYLQSEEDKDDLYHRDPPEFIHQDVVDDDAPVDSPSQRKYSEPEEDLDHLYHH